MSHALALSQMLQTVVPPEAAENGAGGAAHLDRQRLLYCERFVELIIDLLSQLPTRRFVRTLLEDKAILIKARMSPLFTHPEGDSPSNAPVLLCRGIYGILEAGTSGTSVHCMRVPPAAFCLNVPCCLPAGTLQDWQGSNIQTNNCHDSLWGMALPVWAAEGRFH